MPLPATQDSNTDSPILNLVSPRSSYSSPPLTSPNWSHKKFGFRKRAKLPVLPTLRQRRRLALASDRSSAILDTLVRPSPRKEEKKKKRRESDAKWRSNLSGCFKHLETKVLRGKNCLKVKPRLSKEMIVQKTVQKVQYLESLFMLLNQADKCGKKREFSPMKGHHDLNAARKEFSYKFNYKNKRKRKASPKSTGKSTRLVNNTAVENAEGTPVVPEAVVPEHSRTSPGCDQLVPPSATRTADGAKDATSHVAMQTVPSIAQRDTAIPSTPTKSVVCLEQDFPNKSPRTPKFTTKNIILNRYSGRFPQSQVTTSSRPQPYTLAPARGSVAPVRLPKSPAKHPPKSTARSSSSTVSSTKPSLYHQLNVDSKSCLQNKSTGRMQRKLMKLSQAGPTIIIRKEGKEDMTAEDILDVEKVDLVDWPREYFSMTSHGQKDKTKPSEQDTESSQSSLLLHDIPQLPDNIVTPLLMCGESDECFLQDMELDKTLQQPRYPPTVTKHHFKTSKSDDDIVLTILELEESRTSASSRSSPDSIDNVSVNPTSDTKRAQHGFVDVMEIETPDQGFQDQFQGVLLEASELMSAGSGRVGGPPSVILSPARMSRLGNLGGKSSPDRTCYFLISPIKCKREDTSTKRDSEGRERPSGEREDKITESMARFASSALSNQTLEACHRQSVRYSETNHEALDTNYNNTDKVYSGDTQTLLNGQVVGKTSADLKVNSYRPRSTLICIDSGTPTKNPPQLPYSVPSTAKTALVFSSTDPDSLCTYPTSDTDVVASYTSSPPYLSPPSTATPSTPGGYFSLGNLSQSTEDASFSSELPEDNYRLSQQSPPITKQAQWVWSDPQTIDLEADESLDDPMGDDLLARYYQAYDSINSVERNRDENAVMEVPDWHPKKNVASQSSQGSRCSSSFSSISMATGSASQDSTTGTDSLQSGEFQVVPSLSPEDDVEMAEHQFGFHVQGVKYGTMRSPDNSLHIFQHWLSNH